MTILTLPEYLISPRLMWEIPIRMLLFVLSRLLIFANELVLHSSYISQLMRKDNANDWGRQDKLNYYIPLRMTSWDGLSGHRSKLFCLCCTTHYVWCRKPSHWFSVPLFCSTTVFYVKVFKDINPSPWALFFHWAV